MKEQTYFLDMFSDYEPPEPLKSAISQAAIVAADIDPVGRGVQVAVFSQNYIPRRLLETAEKDITELYGLRYLQIRSTHPAEEINKLEREELLAKFVQQNSMTRGSLAGAQWNWEGSTLTIQLLANGKLVTTVIAGVEPQAVLSGDNNWQYTWTNLPVYVNGEKIEWSIRETLIGTEAAKADGSFVNWLVSYELPIHSTDDNGNEKVLLTVTNTTKRVMLRLTKTDISKTLQLKGATFILEAVDKDGNLLTNEVTKTATTGDAGTLIFDNLKCGVRYRLTESVAPDGYLKTDEYVYFMINEDGSVMVEDSYYAEVGSTAYNIIVKNAEAIPLPESGDTGTGMFYALGLLLIAAAGIYIDILLKRGCRN